MVLTAPEHKPEILQSGQCFLSFQIYSRRNCEAQSLPVPFPPHKSLAISPLFSEKEWTDRTRWSPGLRELPRLEKSKQEGWESIWAVTKCTASAIIWRPPGGTSDRLRSSVSWRGFLSMATKTRNTEVPRRHRKQEEAKQKGLGSLGDSLTEGEQELLPGKSNSLSSDNTGLVGQRASEDSPEVCLKVPHKSPSPD